MTQPFDASSHSNYGSWTTLHTVLDVAINFVNKALEGKAVLKLKALASAKEVILDTSYLDIKSVYSDGERLNHDLSKRKDPLGQSLIVHLSSEVEAGTERLLEIEYTTTKNCTALQWLGPAQTAGAKPYMFSQNQAIHARSMFPCQDTPIVKSSFLFRLSSPYVVVATGNYKGTTTSDPGLLTYVFDQPVPIPSYLAA